MIDTSPLGAVKRQASELLPFDEDDKMMSILTSGSQARLSSSTCARLSNMDATDARVLTVFALNVISISADAVAQSYFFFSRHGVLRKALAGV